MISDCKFSITCEGLNNYDISGKLEFGYNTDTQMFVGREPGTILCIEGKTRIEVALKWLLHKTENDPVINKLSEMEIPGREVVPSFCIKYHN